MVATAALNYLANRKAETKTILFKWYNCVLSTPGLQKLEIFLHDFYVFSIHLKPIPVYGLFAACAFGILNKDLVLSKLVLKELDAIERNPEYIPHVAFFHAYCEVLQVILDEIYLIHFFVLLELRIIIVTLNFALILSQGNNSKMAVRKMSKFLFNYPGNASLWLNSCLLLNNLACLAPKEYTKCAMAAAHHANCAISLGRGKIDISKVVRMMFIWLSETRYSTFFNVLSNSMD